MVWHLHLILLKEGNLFYGLASSPDHIKGGELVQNHLISIFYGLASSPDLIKGGELILWFDIFS